MSVLGSPMESPGLLHTMSVCVVLAEVGKPFFTPRLPQRLTVPSFPTHQSTIIRSLLEFKAKLEASFNQILAR